MTRFGRAICRDWVKMGGLIVPAGDGLRLLRAPYPERPHLPRLYDHWQHWLWTTHSRAAMLLLEQAGAAGDVKTAYAASSAITVTALNGGIASSATWVAGWGSGTIDNSANLYLDYMLAASLVAESAGLTAGEARMYGVAELADDTYPDCLSSGTEGTEGAVTFIDTEIRDSVAKLAAVTATDTTASRVYPMSCGSMNAVFGAQFSPRKWFVFITHSMVAALETSGNAVYVKGVYANVAQS